MITQGDITLVEHIAHLGKDERLSADDRLELLVVALAKGCPANDLRVASGMGEAVVRTAGLSGEGEVV
ncbi:hypothetical protein ACFW64_30720, partial [Streptomyces albidoflavus]